MAAAAAEETSNAWCRCAAGGASAAAAPAAAVLAAESSLPLAAASLGPTPVPSADHPAVLLPPFTMQDAARPHADHAHP